MNRSITLVVILAAMAAAVYLQLPRSSSITISDALAYQTNAQGTVFAVELSINNAGPADTLLAVETPTADNAHIMNVGHRESVLAIPAGDTAMLAMDGAHLMMSKSDESFREGAFLPIRLIFDQAGTVTTRARHAGVTTMDHGTGNGIVQTTPPSLSIEWQREPSTDGMAINIQTQNFTFQDSRDVNDTESVEHVPGHGHAHVYLNGLKLGRVYSTEWVGGALPPGSYHLTVSLNSNDHRPYLSEDGLPVADTIRFTVD